MGYLQWLEERLQKVLSNHGHTVHDPALSLQDRRMLLPMGFDKYVDILCLFRRALCMLMAPHKQSSVYAVKLQDKSRGTHTLSAALFESDRQVDFSNLQDKLGPVHYAESWHSTILIGMECPSRAASFALWHNRQLPRSSAQNVVERPTESFLWWATNARTGRYAIYIVDSIEMSLLGLPF